MSGYKNNNTKGKKPEVIKKRSSTGSDDESQDTTVIVKPKLLKLKPNNFQEQLSTIKAYCVAKFGALGDLVHTYSYYDPPKVEIPLEEVEVPNPDYNSEDFAQDDEIPTIIITRPIIFTPENDPYGLELRALQKDSDKRSEEIAQMRKDRPKLYYTLLSLLSADSKLQVENDKSFGDLETSKDPLKLWTIISRIHLTGSNAEATDDDVLNATTSVYLTKQKVQESLAEFTNRFKATYKHAELIDAIDLTPKMKGKLFIQSLDNHRFATLKANIKNLQALGTQTKKITSFESAFNVANEWVVITSKGDGSKPYTQQASFSTEHTTKGKSKPVPWKGKPKQNPSKPPTAKDPPKLKKSKPPYKPCPTPGCGEMHWKNDCPHVQAIKELVEQRRVKSQMTNITVGLDSDEYHCFSMIHAAISETPTPIISDAEAFVAKCDRLVKGDVLLDNQSTVHIFKDVDLLTNIREIKRPMIINGIGGQIKVNKIGHLHPFGNVYFHPKAQANILSYGRVGKKYEIEYSHRDKLFTVHAPGYTLPFHEHESLHKCNFHNFEDYRSEDCLISTVAENESKFSKREVRDAKQASQLTRRMAYPSDKDLIKLVTSGQINDSTVTVQDINRAATIYGPPLASLKGKTVAKVPAIVKPINIPRTVFTNQVLHVDVMFVDNDPYLISIATPLGYTMCSHLSGSRGVKSIRHALLAQVNKYKSQNFRITTLLTDGEGAVLQLEPDLNAGGIIVNPAGPGQHVPVVERKIKTVKERVRAIVNSLPYTLPESMMKWLIFYCISRLNMHPSNTMMDSTCPRENFSGRKINAATDLRGEFGEYVQAHTPPDPTTRNSMTPRTDGCIFLNSTGNLQGSAKFLNLNTGGVVTRDKWTALPIPQPVIDHLNRMAANQKRQISTDPTFRIGATLEITSSEQESTAEGLELIQPPTHQLTIMKSHPEDYDSEGPQLQPLVSLAPAATASATSVQNQEEVRNIPQDPPEETTTSAETIVEEIPAEDTTTEEPPVEETLAPTPLTETSDEPHDDSSTSSEPPVEHNIQYEVDTQYPVSIPEEATHSRYSFRSKRGEGWKEGPWKPKEFGFNITVKQAIKKLGNKALKSIYAELKQMHEKNVWTPVSPKKVKTRHMIKVIRSSMFLKEKYTPTGEFDKLKARLVAGGHMQDRSLYDDVSSPTVATTSVFIIAAIASSEKRKVATVDIGGAYLNAPMKDSEVLMKLDPTLSAYMTDLYPEEYKKYVDQNGTITVKLEKALYGCIESAKLWYEHLSSTIEKMGFKRNPLDICVFNKDFHGKQCTICIHVDDLLITCERQEAIDEVTSQIRDEFKTIDDQRGDIHSYLGMNMDFGELTGVKITMEGFVKDLIKENEVKRTAATPAADHLFTVRDSPKLLSENAKRFHSIVAKLLYLAKRTRPDILTAVIFLTSRVQESTEDDYQKLLRLLRYINYTKTLGIILSAGNDKITQFAFVDASFGTHPDGKGHTGIIITIGGGSIFVKSSKQKIVSKSSTESELIGLSDALSMIIWVRDFLTAQGYPMDAAVIYQDNKSTINLAEKGRSTSERTRHVNIRYFFIHDRIKSGEVKVMHMPTKDMLSDILTKPLQGSLFLKLRAELLNWKI
jgi:hypothetical protein